MTVQSWPSSDKSIRKMLALALDPVYLECRGQKCADREAAGAPGSSQKGRVQESLPDALRERGKQFKAL